MKKSNTMKVTMEQVLLFNNNAEFYKQQHAGKQSPFIYALTKMGNKVKKHVEEFNEDVEAARIELAGKDKDGFLILDGNAYKFTPENRKKLNDKIKELKSKEVDIEPYIATSIPKDLDFSFRQIFTPFVMKELTPEEEEALFKEAD